MRTPRSSSGPDVRSRNGQAGKALHDHRPTDGTPSEPVSSGEGTTGLGDHHARGSLVAEPERRTALTHGTPEQQAALRDLNNGWYQERVLEAVAHLGNIEDAARIAGINPDTVYSLQRNSPEFGERLALARRRFGQRLLGKATAAVLAAEPEQLVKTPTLAIAAVNWYNPDLRPNAVQVDARHLTVNVLTEEQAEAVARALAGVPEGEVIA